ncbi:MAG: helix-turn-helix transcriptional regulator [Candidatus Competibacterales bacterium]
MSYEIDFALASSERIEAVLCHRLEGIRLARNMTQSQLAQQAGVSTRTIHRLERGEGVSLNTFIRVLSALGIQQNLANLLPDPTVRPVERVTQRGRERQRARPVSPQSASGTSVWHWGDEDDD